MMRNRVRRLRSIMAIPLGLAVFSVCAADEGQRAAEGDLEPGFVRIFNGEDLRGWDGDRQVWSVKDGAIYCESPKDGKRNWLIWRGGKPADFELRLRFRFTAGNSGVQVRSKEIQKWWVQGYQVEVAERPKMGLWHHSISPAKYRSHLATAGQKVRIGPDGQKQVAPFAKPEEVQAAYKENDWNDLVVIAEGPRLVQKINGVVFAELVDEDAQYAARSGLVAFQDHGHGTIVDFKDVRLKKLP